MMGDNFVHFFTAQGFFVGVVFGILKSSSADALLVYTLLITLFFYLLSHVIIALYYKTMTTKSYSFAKDVHEKSLDMFVKEINKREKLIDSACKMTDIATKLNSQEDKRDKK